jgi:hypothetical protein
MKRNGGTHPVKVIMVDQRGLFDKRHRAATERVANFPEQI